MGFSFVKKNFVSTHETPKAVQQNISNIFKYVLENFRKSYLEESRCVYMQCIIQQNITQDMDTFYEMDVRFLKRKNSLSGYATYYTVYNIH